MKEREHLISAAFTFLTSFVMYMITLAPTVSLWDCGEFITSSVTLGVPHPPGAPFYLIVGRFFSMLPFSADIAYRVNIISALTSALTVLVLYLIIVRLIKEYAGQPKTIDQKIFTFGGAILGSLTFAFSETFWFNATEAEVYAMSMLLTAMTLYLALKWMENYKELSSLRMLIFCAYLCGLSIGIHLLNLLVLPSILLLVLFYDRKIVTNFNFWGVAAVFLIVGFSTYILIYIRANMAPFLNENDPSNYEKFMSYWNREQYGQESLFTTVFNRKAPFFDYQVSKMYIRYFAWNFIGKGTTLGADKFISEIISLKGLYGLPFLVGIVGLYNHFKRDWRRALAIMTMFIFTGIAIIVYLNQPDPQPRERDYVYVGSYFAFAVWIGVGFAIMLEKISKMLKGSDTGKNLVIGSLIGFGIVIGPVAQISHNFHTNDRRGNYFAWDYSLNILESCEENAILFTNGDNDTFPLWYLQAVEEVRQDVIIVNLSLLNTHWYIKQLKSGNPIYTPINIELDEARIDALSPLQWKEQAINITVPGAVYNDYIKDVHSSFNMKEIESDTTFSFVVKPTMFGQGIRVQDLMILHIVLANRWQRPVYFAMTVSPENKIGMDKHLRLDGMAFKLVPYEVSNYYPTKNIAPEVLARNIIDKFQYRGFNDPTVYFNLQKRDLVQNLRSCYMLAADFYWRKREFDKVLEILEAHDRNIPEDVIPSSSFALTAHVATMYFDSGKPEKMRERLEMILSRGDVDNNLKTDIAQIYLFRLRDTQKAREIIEDILTVEAFHPGAFSLMLNIFDQEKQFQEAADFLQSWINQHPGDAGALEMLKQFREKMAAQDSTGR